MNKRETVETLLDSVQKGDLEIAESMLAEGFQFRSSTVEPINKEAWLGMSVSLKNAVPDLDYHFRVIGAEGEVVRAATQQISLSSTYRQRVAHS